MLGRYDPNRDKRIMEEAKRIKQIHRSRPMKICLLEAIAKEQKREKLAPIFK